MEHILIYTTGASSEEIEDQYDECMGLIEQRVGASLEEDDKIEHLQQLRHHPSITFYVGEDMTVFLAAERMDLQQPGAPAGDIGECMSVADEMLVCRGLGHMVQAQQIAEFVRKAGKVTIANKRITFERGVDIEHIHRVMAAVKERKTTFSGDEILKESWSGGRPPIGTEVVDGQLIKGENYHDVRELIYRVVYDGMSKSKASRKIGCTRKTITNTINKRYELFDIPQQ